ncbi:MAG: DUF5606 domain-containing protein [Bacteroidetes bacterium]|nr:DUF5606 domain-containing protein [Bacteroidota bacterium]
MDLSDILAISGKPGLYKKISTTNTVVVVESLMDKKRFPVFAHEKISSLEEISIFSEDEDLPLKEILKKIHVTLDGEKAIDHKSDPGELKAFFEKAVPEYDKERVYISDIKKVINWYNLLHDQKMLDFSEEEEEKKKEKDEDKDEKTEK